MMKLIYLPISKLTSGTWAEDYTSADAARRFPNALIHFTNTPKLDINPKKGHKDPPGIYFYKTSWLLNHQIANYGTDFKYYYVCKVSGSGILNLNEATYEECLAIAKRNGFDKYYRLAFENPLKYFVDGPMEFRLLKSKHPGAVFYATMDALVNAEKVFEAKFSWLSMLKGVDGLYDPGKGVINKNEPQQVIVFNYKIIKIVEHGENKQANYLNDVALEVMKTLKGTTSFKNGRVIGKMFFNKVGQPENKSPVWIDFDLGNFRLVISYYKDGMKVKESRKIKMVPDQRNEDIFHEVMYSIKNFLEKTTLEPTGRDSVWEESQLHKLAVRLYFGDITSDKERLWALSYGVHEGKFKYYIDVDRFKSYTRAAFTIDPKDDSLTVECIADGKSYYFSTEPDTLTDVPRFKWTKKFAKGTSTADIIKAFRQYYINFIRKVPEVKNGTCHPYALILVYLFSANNYKELTVDNFMKWRKANRPDKE